MSFLDQFAGKFEGIRKTFWDKTQTLGFPQKKDEAFRYVPLTQLSQQAFTPGSVTITCEPSDPNVIVLPLDKAMTSYGLLLQNRWRQSIESESNPFALLNGALHREGLFIYVPPKCKTTLNLSLIVQNSAHPRIELFVGKEAEVTCTSLAELTSWNNSYVGISLEEGARLTFTSLADAPSSAWHFDTIRASLKRDSYFACYHMLFGSKTTRLDLDVALAGENSEAILKGAASVSEKRQAHHRISVNHLAPHTRSTQHYKCLAMDAARCSFEGKIFVKDIAQQTEAYQLNNNIVHGKNAACFSKPNLMIFADDVKASHGSTTADLNEEEIFYLTTRGVTKKQARKFLLKGFLSEIIDQLPLEKEERIELAKRAL